MDSNELEDPWRIAPSSPNRIFPFRGPRSQALREVAAPRGSRPHRLPESCPSTTASPVGHRRPDLDACANGERVDPHPREPIVDHLGQLVLPSQPPPKPRASRALPELDSDAGPLPRLRPVFGEGLGGVEGAQGRNERRLRRSASTRGGSSRRRCSPSCSRPISTRVMPAVRSVVSAERDVSIICAMVSRLSAVRPSGVGRSRKRKRSVLQSAK